MNGETSKRRPNSLSFSDKTKLRMKSKALDHGVLGMLRRKKGSRKLSYKKNMSIKDNTMESSDLGKAWFTNIG